MAIDTREKRMAMLGFGFGANLDTLFEADGSVDADDRAHMIDLYSGFGDPGAVGGDSSIEAAYQRRKRRRRMAWVIVFFFVIVS